MNQLAMLQAAMPDPPTQITNAHKAEWNKFLDYLNTKGYRGNKELDRRDTNLGKGLMEEYQRMNPQSPINYDLVRNMQEAVAQDWDKMRQIQGLEGVQATNADDRPLSPTDGWLGSLTSNGYFPTATTRDAKGRVIKEWGNDLDGYYQSLLQEKAAKIPVLAGNKK